MAIIAYIKDKDHLFEQIGREWDISVKNYSSAFHNLIDFIIIDTCKRTVPEIIPLNH